jgi:hypothetical protein
MKYRKGRTISILPVLGTLVTIAYLHAEAANVQSGDSIDSVAAGIPRSDTLQTPPVGTPASTAERTRSRNRSGGRSSQSARRYPRSTRPPETDSTDGFFEMFKPSADALKSSVRKTRSGTVVLLTLPQPKAVTISVTDPAGHTVYTVSRKNLTAGKHSFTLPPRTTRGMHLVKIITPDDEIVHKVSGW